MCGKTFAVDLGKEPRTIFEFDHVSPSRVTLDGEHDPVTGTTFDVEQGPATKVERVRKSPGSIDRLKRPEQIESPDG